MKAIPNYPNYAITKDGRVWSKPRKSMIGRILKGRWLKSSYDNCGYFKIGLEGYTHRIHRLVLETYVGSCPAGMECRHLNGIRIDNRLENLKWGTHSENQQDKILHRTDNRGEKHPLVKLTKEKVRVIFHAYHDGYYTQRQIAKTFGIAQTLVSAITRKEIWFHLWN